MSNKMAKNIPVRKVSQIVPKEFPLEGSITNQAPVSSPKNIGNSTTSINTKVNAFLTSSI